jgi:hypothetical protein
MSDGLASMASVIKYVKDALMLTTLPQDDTGSPPPAIVNAKPAMPKPAVPAASRVSMIVR